jgi:hypothetical protein
MLANLMPPIFSEQETRSSNTMARETQFATGAKGASDEATFGAPKLTLPKINIWRFLIQAQAD